MIQKRVNKAASEKPTYNHQHHAVGIIILAAGRSKRFGADKRIATLEKGRTLLEVTLSHAIETELPCYVVLHPGDHELIQYCHDLGIQAGICPDANLGIGCSIAHGVYANQAWDGWIIARGDMPFIRPNIYQSLAKHLQKHACARPIDRKGQPGFPTAFGKRYAFKLMALNGHHTEVGLIPNDQDIYLRIDSSVIHRDINRPSDITQRITQL